MHAIFFPGSLPDIEGLPFKIAVFQSSYTDDGTWPMQTDVQTCGIEPNLSISFRKCCEICNPWTYMQRPKETDPPMKAYYSAFPEDPKLCPLQALDCYGEEIQRTVVKTWEHTLFFI